MGKDSSTVSRRDFLKFTGKTGRSVSGVSLRLCTDFVAVGGKIRRRACSAPLTSIITISPRSSINEIKQHGKRIGGIEYYTPKHSRESPLSNTVSQRQPAQFRPAPGRDRKAARNHEPGQHCHRDGGSPNQRRWAMNSMAAVANLGRSSTTKPFMSLVKRHPNRFAGIATVPLQDPSRAAKVLEYAIVNLKMSGVTIASNVVGKYYDSKDFDPFWKKAEELDVMMIMHPEWVAGSDKMGGYGLRTVCGNPADTTLSVGYMIYSGVFDRFPKLEARATPRRRLFPYHLGRFDRGLNSGSGAGPSRIAASQPPSKYLKNLYFDNLVYRVETVEYLKRMVGTGTRHGRNRLSLRPWRLDGSGKIQQMNCTDAERDAMLHGNARNLLRIPADQQA